MEIEADKGNVLVLSLICVPVALLFPIIGVYKGTFFELMFEQGAIWGSLFVLSAPFFLWIWAKEQKLELSHKSISHKSLEQFRLRQKEFYLNKIDGYKFERGALVIKEKGKAYPKFPHGPNTDLTGVIIIPPLFCNSYDRIMEYLHDHGIKHL